MPGSFNGKTTSILRKDKRMRCHAGSNPAPGAQNTFTPSLTKKQSTMEKNYIQKADVADIMEHLAERAMKNLDKVSLEMSIKQWCGDITLDVVIRSRHTYKALTSKTYVIIESLKDDLDISDEVMDAGLAKWEEEDMQRKAEEQTSETSEEETNI